MSLLCALAALALAPKAWSQTDAFEFKWPGNTDQCGVSLSHHISLLLDADHVDVRSYMEWGIASFYSFLCVSDRRQHWSKY
jgi:hypothetical protein